MGGTLKSNMLRCSCIVHFYFMHNNVEIWNTITTGWHVKPHKKQCCTIVYPHTTPEVSTPHMFGLIGAVDMARWRTTAPGLHPTRQRAGSGPPVFCSDRGTTVVPGWFSFLAWALVISSHVLSQHTGLRSAFRSVRHLTGISKVAIISLCVLGDVPAYEHTTPTVLLQSVYALMFYVHYGIKTARKFREIQGVLETIWCASTVLAYFLENMMRRYLGEPFWPSPFSRT